VWSVIAAGASLGFIARDLLGLPRTAVALAWIAGALVGGVAARSEKGRRARRSSV
jgi:hypothetical protein